MNVLFSFTAVFILSFTKRALLWLISGSIVVDGHELHEEDLRLMYTFNQASGSAAQYEAHSDAQVWLKQERCLGLYSSF